jgi:hypothetical protein
VTRFFWLSPGSAGTHEPGAHTMTGPLTGEPRERGSRDVPVGRRGVVNDYVTWIVLGLAGLGGVLALVVR